MKTFLIFITLMIINVSIGTLAIYGLGELFKIEFEWYNTIPMYLVIFILIDTVCILNRIRNEKDT